MPLALWSRCNVQRHSWQADRLIFDRLICGLWDKERQSQVLREPFDNQLSFDKGRDTNLQVVWSRYANKGDVGPGWCAPNLLYFANAPRTRPMHFQINGLARQTPKLSASFVGKVHMPDIDVLLPIGGVWIVENWSFLQCMQGTACPVLWVIWSCLFKWSRWKLRCHRPRGKSPGTLVSSKGRNTQSITCWYQCIKAWKCKNHNLCLASRYRCRCRCNLANRCCLLFPSNKSEL